MYKQTYGYEFELGRGKNYSVNQVLQMFQQTAEYLPARPGEALTTLNTDNTAREVLGWEPTRNLTDYLKEVIK